MRRTAVLFVAAALLVAACEGTPRHTVVIDSRDVDGRTAYTLEVSGSLSQVSDSVAGFPVTADASDEVSGATVEGRVSSGADGYRVKGEIADIHLADPAAARVYVDGQPHFTEEHTVVVDGTGSGGETNYTLEVTGRIEQVEDSLAGHAVSVDPSDRLTEATATGRVADDADGYRVQGGIASVDVADPGAATVYVDGRERHTVVIDGGDVPGSTGYTVEVGGRIEQVDGSVAGHDVSGGDRVEGGTATGRVGGGADGFVTSGPVVSIELDDPSAARVYVDGEPHFTTKHTVVIDGSGSEGETDYTVGVTGRIEAAGDTVAGRAAAVEPEDRTFESRAAGSVGTDADGYRVRGGLRSIELNDPSSATVYLDGREYHTIVLDGGGGSGSTSYRIEVDGRIEQADGSVAGHDVSGGDRVEGGIATGRVGGGADGFRVFGAIRSIEVDDPGAAVLYVDGAERPASAGSR